MTAMLALLGRVPIAAWMVAALLAYAGWQRMLSLEHRAELVEMRRSVEQADAQAKREEFRRVEAIQGVINEATTRADRTAADARRARAAAERMRAELAAIATAAAASDTTAAAPSDAAATIGLQSELLGQCVENYRRMARTADEARDAGLACQASYESLRLGGSN